jgi:hypothetical protein
MKNRSLIFGIAVFVSAALIFSGCEQETKTEYTAGATTGAAADPDGLIELLATEGVNEVTYYGDLTIGNKTLVIPAGKIVTVKGGGVTLSGGILGVAGTLALDTVEKITGTGTVAGSEDVLALIAEGGPTPLKLYTSLTLATAAFATEDEAALVNVASGDLAVTAVPANKTLYVLGDLTITTAPAPTGTVKALGRLVFKADADISGYASITTFDYSKATLAITAAAKVKLPATATIAAIDASKGVFTVDGATSLTVGKLTGTLALPNTVTVVAIAGGTGSVTVAAKEGGTTFTTAASFGNTGTVTFSGAATFTPAASFAGAVTFSDTATFSDSVEFGGDVVLTAEKVLSLAKDKTLTLANGKSVKVGESALLTADAKAVLTAGSSASATLTPAAAKLSLAGDNLELTSGELTVVAELALGQKLTAKGTLNVAGSLSTTGYANIAASGTGKVKTTGENGKVVVGSGDNTATLTKATIDASALTLGATGAITTAGTGTLVFGATTFSGAGAWTVSVSSGENNTVTGVKITSATGGATIAAAGPTSFTGTATLTASGTPVIIQAAASSNALTIGANTVIALGGTADAAAGKIVLTGASSNPGKLTLTATTSVVKTGNTAGTGAFATAAKIGGKTFGTSTVSITTTANAAAGKLATVTAGDANKDLVGGADADNTITIDSTQSVASS